KILMEIQTCDKVFVNNLSEKLKVSPLTIRRDLQVLEDNGFVERFYGGAKFKEEKLCLREKEDYIDSIAKIASRYIEDNDVIFVNSSKITLKMLEYIHSKNVNVITNNANAVLINNPNISVILTGGELNINKKSLTGGKATQPNLRAAPIVFDPFAVKNVDAVLSTHYHNDHIDPFYAAAVMKNVNKEVPFIGPKKCIEKWISYGVPAERCIEVKPGDVVKVNEVEIVVLDSFDRTCLVTADEDIRGVCPTDMDEKAVNYLIKTDAGSIYHSGDSHYSVYYAKHGKDHEIDVALGSFGENPIGNQDKMTSI
ncbi:Metal-dependent hydrolase, partial [Candidatus Arthromitus sp. SFB-4]